MILSIMLINSVPMPKLKHISHCLHAMPSHATLNASCVNCDNRICSTNRPNHMNGNEMFLRMFLNIHSSSLTRLDASRWKICMNMYVVNTKVM